MYGSNVATWKKAPNNSNILSEDTLISFENPDKNTYKWTYDWASKYGELGAGEYEFRHYTNDLGYPTVTIKFIIKENGEILYYKPTLF